MTLADVVSNCVEEYAVLEPLTFDDLVLLVRRVLPEADVCEIDAAARPFERGSAGAFTYEPAA